MNILVLGNSHIGSLRDAWSELYRQYPDLNLVFFGAVGLGKNPLVWNGNALLPSDQGMQEMFRVTSGGLDKIVPSEYQAAVVCGMGLGYQLALNLYKKHRLYSQQNWDENGVRLISRACLTELLANRIRISAACNLLRQLREHGLQRAVLQCQPGVSERILNVPSDAQDLKRYQSGFTETDHETWSRQQPQRDIFLACAREDWASIHGLMAQACELVAKTEGAPCLLQPLSSQAHHILTKREFNIHAGAFLDSTAACSPEDIVHMNKEYGGLVLKNILAALGITP